MVRLQKYTLSCAQSLLMTSSSSFVILRGLSLDNALRDAGLQRNCSKDVNLAGTMTGLGCDLSNAPPLIEPAAEKMKLVNAKNLGDPVLPQSATCRSQFSAGRDPMVFLAAKTL